MRKFIRIANSNSKQSKITFSGQKERQESKDNVEKRSEDKKKIILSDGEEEDFFIYLY